MHAELDYVFHVQVVDVQHSQLKSVVMEKVGCQRALNYLMNHINVAELVTDALSQHRSDPYDGQKTSFHRLGRLHSHLHHDQIILPQRKTALLPLYSR